MKKTEKKELLHKARGAIQITNTLSMTQHHCFNYLLYRAYNDLETKDFHAIKLTDLAEHLCYDIRHAEEIKDNLKALAGTVVTWNFIEENGLKSWGGFTLLGSYDHKEGMIIYEYPRKLIPHLANPKVYATINLAIQMKFDHKNSLKIWEFCSDYRKLGYTGWIPLDEFKNLLGLIEQYPLFKDLNKYVIKPAVKEINQRSDLLILPEFKKWGRAVHQIKFVIEVKNPRHYREWQRPDEQSQKSEPVFEQTEMFANPVQFNNEGSVQELERKIWSNMKKEQRTMYKQMHTMSKTEVPFAEWLEKKNIVYDVEQL